MELPCVGAAAANIGAGHRTGVLEGWNMKWKQEADQTPPEMVGSILERYRLMTDGQGSVVTTSAQSPTFTVP